MPKTLALILNYNFPEITDPLFESLKPYVDDTHDLAVLDNCSDPDRRSKYTTFITSHNGYFGGGLNAALDIMRKGPEYDSLLFMTNDISVDTLPLVQPMREVMFRDGYHWVGACVNEPPFGTHWKQNRPWGTNAPRQCKWFDLQCTLFHRELVEAIGHYDECLKYGWGPDIWTGMVVEDRGWRACVLDYVQVTHKGGNLTFQEKRSDIGPNEYVLKCLAGMHQFFSRDSHRFNRYNSMRQWADRYSA